MPRHIEQVQGQVVVIDGKVSQHVAPQLLTGLKPPVNRDGRGEEGGEQ